MVSAALVALSAALFAVASAQQCTSPTVSATGYSTTDAFFHFQTAVVVDFSVTCANGAKNVPLYVIANRKTYIAAAAEETGKYQVSLLLEHGHAASQTIQFGLYDEEAYAAYRKDDNAKPIATFSYSHPGLARKWPVSSESVAILLSLVAVYYAFTYKSALN